MKKRILTLMLAVLTILAVTACDKNPEQGDVKPDDNVIEQPDTKEEKTVYVAEYEDVLADAYEFIVNIENKVGPDDGFYGIWNAAIALEDEALEKIGFVFKDVNDDGVYELMIGAFDKADGAYTNNEIYALYTLSDDEPQLLFDGWGRSVYSLKEDASFFYQGSDGAPYSIFGTYYMNENNEIVCKDYYFTSPDENDPSVVEIYHNDTGIFYEDFSEKLDITLDDFWALEEEAAKGTVKLSATPFAKLDAEIIEKALAAKPVPDVSHLEGEWVMVGGETEGYEYTAEEEGMSSEIAISRSEDVLTAKYFSKTEYTDYKFEAILFYREEPVYNGCGNDVWSVEISMLTSDYADSNRFYATLVDENTLLLQEFFLFDGMQGVSYRTYERK